MKSSILVIEDDAGVRQSLVDILEISGHTVVGVGSVAAARRHAPQHGVAIVDVMLPDGNGVDVARELRATHPQLDVVFLTAAASLDSAIEAIELGAVRYLPKPCPPSTLLSIVDQILEQRALRQTMVEGEKQFAVGRLAAGVAHEIGTPLNIISGRAEMLLARAGEGSRDAEALRVIVDQTDRITMLVRQLLDFSRAETHERAVIPLRTVLAETLPLISTRPMQVSIQNLVSDSSHALYGSFHQLQQLVLNLVLNAVDAEASTVVIRCEAIDELTLRLTVSDDGVGIPVAKLGAVFAPFYTTKPRGEGTGLGLAVVYNIVRDHGGEIWAERIDTGGTRFVVLLPRRC